MFEIEDLDVGVRAVVFGSMGTLTDREEWMLTKAGSSLRATAGFLILLAVGPHSQTASTEPRAFVIVVRYKPTVPPALRVV